MTRRSKAKAELGLTAAMVWLACAGLFSSRAWAQASPPPSDVYRLNYYANAPTRAPDATVHIVNPTAATLCADIYVFDANQNENECCSCPITPQRSPHSVRQPGFDQQPAHAQHSPDQWRD